MLLLLYICVVSYLEGLLEIKTTVDLLLLSFFSFCVSQFMCGVLASI